MSDVGRTRWFSLGAGDRLADEGVVRLRGGAFFDRDESFALVAHADGGYTLSSRTTALSGAFSFEAMWRYDASFNGLGARAIGTVNGKPIEVEITTANDMATVHVTQDGAALPVKSFALPHGAMIDIEPAALPTFTMLRRYDAARGGIQSTRWIGRSTTRDSVLTHGVAHTRLIGEKTVDGRTALHFGFLEEMGNPAEGPVFKMPFQLWTDEMRSPVKFMVRGAQSTVIGVRDGWEKHVDALQPVDFATLNSFTP
jgi:hypothetical protein